MLDGWSSGGYRAPARLSRVPPSPDAPSPAGGRVVQTAAGGVPSLQVVVQPMPLLTDEDASGDARPDLDTHLREAAPY